MKTFLASAAACAVALAVASCTPQPHKEADVRAYQASLREVEEGKLPPYEESSKAGELYDALQSGKVTETELGANKLRVRLLLCAAHIKFRNFCFEKMKAIKNHDSEEYRSYEWLAKSLEREIDRGL